MILSKKTHKTFEIVYVKMTELGQTCLGKFTAITLTHHATSALRCLGYPYKHILLEALQELFEC